MRIYPLNTPKLSELVKGISNFKFPDKKISKEKLMNHIKTVQRKMVKDKFGEGRAFGTTSKNKYTVIYRESYE